jgi:hypothetical protein
MHLLWSITHADSLILAGNLHFLLRNDLELLTGNYGLI